MADAQELLNESYSSDSEPSANEMIEMSRQQVRTRMPSQLERLRRQIVSSGIYKSMAGAGSNSHLANRQVMSPRGQQVLTRTVQSLVPNIPRGARPSSYSSTSSMGTGRRGRPKKYPQGVFAYRRQIAAYKRQAKAIQGQRAMILQKQQMAMMARGQMPQRPAQQVYQQYQQQNYPQQAQRQMQQAEIPYQMPQETQKRPIATVFRSSGGSPYPPVDTRPLADTGGDYYESTDAFTGRRIMVKRMRPESWLSGGR